MATMLCVSHLAFFLPGHTEWIVLLVLGLLIFGRRLPEVGRSLGRGIVEFKRGIKGVEDEIEETSSKSGRTLPREPSTSSPTETDPPANPPEEGPAERRAHKGPADADSAGEGLERVEADAGESDRGPG